jgi:hypothetical protein
MIPTVGGGSDFHGAVMYLYEGRRDAPKDKAVTILFAAGVRTSSPEAMIADFNLGRAANPELKQAVWSGTLSFNPDDLAAGTLPDAKMLEITLAHCQKMGLDKTQLVVALHQDTDKPHTHILANRVADDGHTISDSNNRQRAQAAAQELVAEFGLTPANGNRPELQNPDRVVGQPARASAYMRQGLAYGLQESTSREELRAALEPRKIGMRETALGVSFTHEGVSLKGSSIGREFSGPAIDRELAANRERQAAVRRALLLEQKRVAEQTIAAIRGEEQSIAFYKAQAVQEKLLPSAFSTRKLQYGQAKMQEAERRMKAYEAQAKTTPAGRELLTQYSKELTQPAGQAGLQHGKVLKDEIRLTNAQALASAPVQNSVPVLPVAVKAVIPESPAQTSSAPAVVLTPAAGSTSTQGLMATSEAETPAAKAPPGTARPTTAASLAARPVEKIAPSLTVPALTSISATPVAAAAAASVPDSGVMRQPAPSTRAQNSQLGVVKTSSKEGVAATAPSEASTLPGEIRAAESPMATSRAPIGSVSSADLGKTIESPKLEGQPSKAQKEASQSLPALSLAAMLISSVPDIPANAAVAAPAAAEFTAAASAVVEPVKTTPSVSVGVAPAVAEPAIDKVAWQHGIIRMMPTDQRTSEARLTAVRVALLAAGATVGELVPPQEGKNSVAFLPYAFKPTMRGLDKVTTVLNDVQASATAKGESDSKVQEQRCPWHELSKSATADPLSWPDRTGQFNQAHISVNDPITGQARAERLAADLLNAGANVSAITRDKEGCFLLQVSYHTHLPGIEKINETLEGASNSRGIGVQESKQNNGARYTGAVHMAERPYSGFGIGS